MRIVNLLFWNDASSTGVLQKVQSMTTQWAATGHDVFLQVVTRSQDVANWCSQFSGQELRRLVRTYRYSSLLDRNSVTRAAVADAVDWSADVLYTRHDFYTPALVAASRTVPVVLEVNTDDVQEARFRSLPNRAFMLLTRRRALHGATGIVYLTRELANNPSFSWLDRPHEVIANGIDLSRYQIESAENTEPRIVFIGTGTAPWHGLDKLMDLALRRPEWRFDVIGSTADDLGVLPSNVTAHGQLAYANYRAALAFADVAIGTLALHRKGMGEACPLKIREYLAHGLPTITAYSDTDFMEPRPFILQLPNEERNVRDNLPSIDRFVSAWRGHRVPREAVQHLDIQHKERSRIDFLTEVVSRKLHV